MDDKIKELLLSGKVGVIPTDTIYGLVARAADAAAVNKLYQLKHRQSKPGTLIAADIKQLEDLGLKHRYIKAVEQYWPGPVSVLIPISGNSLSYLTQGKSTIAVRLPDQMKLQSLLEQTGPLITSSANTPGEKPAENIDEAREYFKDKVDFYVDGGDLSGRQPSTIIRIIDDAVELVRQGAVKIL